MCGCLVANVVEIPIYWGGFLGFLVCVLFIFAYGATSLYLLRVPVALLNLPLYCVSYFVPKNQRLWLFGCRQGVAYAENSRYLFEWICQRNVGIDACWVTKSRIVFEKLQERDMPVVMAYSLRGYWMSMRASCVFMSNFRRAESDYNDYVTSPSTIKIQLWHGSPLKRVGVQRPVYIQSYLLRLLAKLYYVAFPFYKNRTSCHKMLAASPKVADNLSASFNLEVENIWILGYPKNDLWLQRAALKSNDHISATNVVYMPTWRLQGLKIFSEYGFDPDELNTLFSRNGVHFYFKLHHFTLEEMAISFSEIDLYSNLHILRSEDVYEELDRFDVLVTDYSSVLFDYLLTDRPVVFAPFDLDKYSNSDQGFYEDYLSLVPGPVAYNWRSLAKSIVEIVEDDHYSEKRQDICKRYNLYLDSGSSERLVGATRDLISQERKPKVAYH
nr:CDP-glycerol glycerophosphotransferase family protein [Parahaliea mediterranea]